MCKNDNVSCNQDILRSSVWFNSHINKNKMFFQNWFAKNICEVAKIVDSEGNVMDLESLKRNTALILTF